MSTFTAKQATTLGAGLIALGKSIVPGAVYPCVPNPKAPASRSYARFALYKPGITIGAYVAACVASGQPHAKRNARADIAWDRSRGYINMVT